MRRLLILAFALGVSGYAWANACVAQGNGNWRSITWNTCGGSYPGNAGVGDTADVNGHAVTIPAAETDIVGTDAAVATNEMLIDGASGSLTINGTLTSHGSVGMSTSGSLIIGSGGILEFANAHASPPAAVIATTDSSTTPITVTGSNTNNVGWNTATAATIRTAATNGVSWSFSVTLATNPTAYTFTWARFSGCGSKTTHVDCIASASNFTATHWLQDNSNAFDWNAGGSGASNLNINYWTVRTTASDGHTNGDQMFLFGPSAVNTTGTRFVKNSSFWLQGTTAGDADILIEPSSVANTSLTWDSNITFAQWNQTNGLTTTVSNSLFGSPPTMGTFIGAIQNHTGPQKNSTYSNIGYLIDCTNWTANVTMTGAGNTDSASGANTYTDWQIAGTPSACNTLTGWVTLAFGDNDTLNGLLQTNTAGAVFNTITGTGIANTNLSAKNITVYKNNPTNVNAGAFIINPGSATKLVNLTNVAYDTSSGGLGGFSSTTAQQSSLNLDFLNITNYSGLGGSNTSYLAGWDKAAGVLGIECAATLCQVSRGTTTVSSVGGSPCTMTLAAVPSGTQVGDFIIKNTTSEGAHISAIAGSVVTLDVNNLNGALDCAGIANTNTVHVYASLFTSTTNWYGVGTGFGGNDTAKPLQFANSAATPQTWSTMRGGAGTIADARHRMLCGQDGVAEDASLGTFGGFCNVVPGDSFQEYMSYMRAAFTIFNGSMANRAYLVYNAAAVQ